MTAITKTYTSIADASIDPDAPLLSSLMYALRDNIEYLKEWLGASYASADVQDHNHDGVNSALIQVGGNLLRNGSFESDTASWTTTAYTGGTVAINTANAMDGGKCLAFTSTVLANGGGYADSDEFIPVGEGVVYAIKALVKASVANVSCKIDVDWYDAAQSLVSSSTAYSSSNTATTQTMVGSDVTAPSTARYMKARITGGVPATGSAVGTVYFDGVQMSGIMDMAAVAGASYMSVLERLPAGGVAATGPAYIAASAGTWIEAFNGRVNTTGNYRVSFFLDGLGYSGTTYGRIYRNGAAYGTSQSLFNTAGSFTEDLFFYAGDTVQLFVNAAYVSGTIGARDFKLGASLRISNVTPPTSISIGDR